MNELHFKSEWLPRLPTKNGWRIGGILTNVAYIANELDCPVSYAKLYIRKDGCTIIPFMWRASSEDILNHCLSIIAETVLDQITFDNLHIITKSEFEGYFDDSGFEPIYIGIGGGLEANTIFHFEEIAKQNELILSE